MQNLRILPKLRDSLSYLFIEHAIIDQKDQAIEYINAEGHVMVPVAALSLLLLGPGTSITHAAVRTLAENGCAINWVGEYSPHAWGWTGFHVHEPSTGVSIPHTRGDGPDEIQGGGKCISVFPTRVGMDRRMIPNTTEPICIPHTRGDGPAGRPLTMTAWGYSPHAWGWTGARSDA